MSYHGIFLHVVFSTKFRKPVLDDGCREDLFGYIGGTIREHKAELIVGGGVEDHVHLLVRINPKYAISATMKLLKANSARWINQEKKTRSKFQWQPGYGAFSVSKSGLKDVIAYIENQQEHHKKVSYQDEFLLLLKRYEIDFNPDYVFEEEVVG